MLQPKPCSGDFNVTFYGDIGGICGIYYSEGIIKYGLLESRTGQYQQTRKRALADLVVI